MKRTIALVAVTLIALAAAFAAQTSLRDYLMDAKYQAAGVSYSSDIGYIASPKGSAMAVAGPDVSVTVYNPEGELDYTLSGKWEIALYMSSSVICLNKDSGYRETVGFSLDSWLHEGAYTVARTRDGQTVVIIDWTFVRNGSSRLFSHHV